MNGTLPMVVFHPRVALTIHASGPDILAESMKIFWHAQDDLSYNSAMTMSIRHWGQRTIANISVNAPSHHNWLKQTNAKTSKISFR